nr:unnamed protein product [Callosobruchus chinensis]
MQSREKQFELSVTQP